MLALAAVILAQSFSDAALISADPDAPIAEIGWQSALRAKIGLPVPLISRGKGPWFFVGLPSFFELHNAPGNGSWVPFQLWRARVQLAGGAIFSLSEAFALSLTLRLEHESDHATAGAVMGAAGYVNLNSIAVPATLRWQRGSHAISTTLTPRLHVLTCTVSAVYCAQGGGAWGDRSFEASFAISYQRMFWLDDASALDAFASLFSQYIVPTRQVHEEFRIVTRIGVGLSRPGLGRTYLFASLWIGTLPGYLRDRGGATLPGFGFGWTP